MAFVGRESELQFLNQYYQQEGSRIIVVYGQKGVGKTALLSAFGENYNCTYYQARTCSEKEQRFQWAEELKKSEKKISDCPEYEEILDCLVDFDEEEKQVLVIDEFHNIVKTDPVFFSVLCTFAERVEKDVLVILCSSASGWVENSMVSRIGQDAAAISGFLKVRELSVRKMQEIYPEMAEDDIIQIYAVLGGVPGLWNCIDRDLGAGDNLIRNIIDRYSRIFYEMSMYLTEELRETSVYNTILSAMASGNSKLNNIYLRTGFSRAKISVYLKNLMELDLVEKVDAGTYRISKAHVRFYFRFLFSNQSLLEELTPERFYKEIVEDAFPGFVREAYRRN